MYRLTPIFKKDDATEIGNYRPIALLSIPSKILESEVNDSLVDHGCLPFTTRNQLVLGLFKW